MVCKLRANSGAPGKVVNVEINNTSGFGGSTQPGATGMAPPALPPMCRKCGRVIDSNHKFCPHCGQRQDLGSAWYYHPVWILVLAFCVLGPLAIPLVWRSQRMSLAAKAMATVAILLYTVYCVYAAWQVVRLELQFSGDLGNVMRELHPR